MKHLRHFAAAVAPAVLKSAQLRLHQNAMIEGVADRCRDGATDEKN